MFDSLVYCNDFLLAFFVDLIKNKKNEKKNFKFLAKKCVCMLKNFSVPDKINGHVYLR